MSDIWLGVFVGIAVAILVCMIIHFLTTGYGTLWVEESDQKVRYTLDVYNLEKLSKRRSVVFRVRRK